MGNTSIAGRSPAELYMPNKNGQNFICFLPKVEEANSGKPVLQQNTSSMIVETEKRVKVKTPDELLQVPKFGIEFIA
jgi:protein OS-9